MMVKILLKNFSLYSGMIIPLWLLVGVTVAGVMNPGYSHINQAMSELGAEGSPTHFISPVINNYSLGILLSLLAFISSWNLNHAG